MGSYTVSIAKFEPNALYDFMDVYGSPGAYSYKRWLKKPDGSLSSGKVIKLYPNEEYTIETESSSKNGAYFYKDGLPITETSFTVTGQDLLNYRYAIKTGDANAEFKFKITEIEEQDILGGVHLTNSWGGPRLLNDSEKSKSPNTPPSVKFEGALKVGENPVDALVKYNDLDGDKLRSFFIDIKTPNVKLSFGGQIFDPCNRELSAKQLKYASVIVPEKTSSVEICTKVVDQRLASSPTTSQILTVSKP